MPIPPAAPWWLLSCVLCFALLAQAGEPVVDPAQTANGIPTSQVLAHPEPSPVAEMRNPVDGDGEGDAADGAAEDGQSTSETGAGRRRANLGLCDGS